MENTKANKKDSLKRDIYISLVARYSRSKKELEKNAEFLQMIVDGASLFDASYKTQVGVGNSAEMLYDIARTLSRIHKELKSELLSSIQAAIEKVL
jgi:hypothetical protein